MNYNIEWSEDDDCYIATSLKFGVKTHGDTKSEAIEELKIVCEECEAQILKSHNTEYIQCPCCGSDQRLSDGNEHQCPFCKTWF